LTYVASRVRRRQVVSHRHPAESEWFMRAASGCPGACPSELPALFDHRECEQPTPARPDVQSVIVTPSSTRSCRHVVFCRCQTCVCRESGWRCAERGRSRARVELHRIPRRYPLNNIRFIHTMNKHNKDIHFQQNYDFAKKTTMSRLAQRASTTLERDARAASPHPRFRISEACSDAEAPGRAPECARGDARRDSHGLFTVLVGTVLVRGYEKSSYFKQHTYFKQCLTNTVTRPYK